MPMHDTTRDTQYTRHVMPNFPMINVCTAMFGLNAKNNPAICAPGRRCNAQQDAEVLRDIPGSHTHARQWLRHTRPRTVCGRGQVLQQAPPPSGRTCRRPRGAGGGGCGSTAGAACAAGRCRCRRLSHDRRGDLFAGRPSLAG